MVSISSSGTFRDSACTRRSRLELKKTYLPTCTLVPACRLYGSALPRVLPFSCLSAGLTAILYFFPGRSYFEEIWGHPYIYYNLSFIVGFVLVFRSNFAYGRFVTGRVQLQNMSSMWAYACTTALAFEALDLAHRLGRDEGNYENVDEFGVPRPFDFNPAHVDPQKYTAALRRYEGFKAMLLHKFSLLHALCLQHLRQDWKLSNLAPHTPEQEPPPEDAAALVDYKFDILQLFALPASARQALTYAEVTPLPILPGLNTQDSGANGMIKGGAVTHDELHSLGYRFEAFAEAQFETLFGAGNELRRSTTAEAPILRRTSIDDTIDGLSVDGSRTPMDDGMSILTDTSHHGTMLSAQISGASPRSSLARSPRGQFDKTSEAFDEIRMEEPTSPKPRKMPSLISKIFQQQTGMFVIGAQERAYTGFGWVQSILAQRCSCKTGWITVASPTSNTLWHSLDSGFQAFEQCRALVDTPFPFPWAQAMVLFLVVFSLTLPLLMVSWLRTVWLACLMDFVTVFCFWILNEVARDLESPFVFPPNDLPLARMQYNFNERLLAACAASFEDVIQRDLEYHAPPPVIRMERPNAMWRYF
jgi:predicted membrane chloride channel (bestrophin family)